MKNMFNLLVYLAIIVLLVFICNSLSKVSEKEKYEESLQNVSGNPTISFDYETVPEEEPPAPIEERYHKELKNGTTVYPQYTNDQFSDQKAIFNYEMYQKPIHVDRSSTNENDIAKTISQIFDESITDFKKLTPLKAGREGDFVIQGASDSSTFNPDFISYDDEKPENGGKVATKKSFLYGYDPMINTQSSLF